MMTNPPPLKSTPTAVVVNDNPIQRELLSGFLAKEGMVVQSFSSADLALEGMNSRTPPDLIITDLYLPGIDGWRFCRLLRSSDYTPFNHVPILVISATFADEDAISITADLGANAILPSPVDEHEFRDHVLKVLRGEQPIQSLQVLIVEDDEILSLLLKMVFEEHGYQVDTALTGLEAETQFKSKVYDIVILDYYLPDTQGVRLLAELQPLQPDAVYLAMTVDSNPELALKWMKQGAAAFVRKPFDPQFLIELCVRARRERYLLRMEQRLRIRVQELRQSKERFAAFMRNLPAAAFIKDQAGRTLFVNQYLEKLLEFQNWAGKTASELIPGEMGRKMAEDDEKALDSGYLKTEETIIDSQRIVRIFETIKFSLRVEEGMSLLGGIALDVTERKRSEAALHESEVKFRSVVDSSPMAMHLYRLDANGRLILMDSNPAADRMLGIEHRLLLGKSIDDAFPQLQVTEIPGMYRKVARGELGPQSFEIPYRDERFSGVYEVHCFKTGPDTMAVAFLDISNRKRLEEQLAQAQKMESIGRLAGGVAHDFNNMLGAILGNVAFALEDLPMNSPLRENLEEIEKCAHRSADLTRQLLAFARKQTIAPKVLDLNAELEAMLKMLRRLIGEDIDLVWLPASDLWQVKIDPSQINQILANLCVNARDAIQGVGKVTLETENISIDETYVLEHPGFIPGDYVMLVVSDSGRGMDKEVLKNLFEPFFTTKGLGHGTGLGLSTVYGIVRQNNGFINVFSEPNCGTIFKIYLPRNPEVTSEIQSTPQAQTTARGHETVLLVEDEPSLLRISKRMLESLGYTVLAAFTPGEAVHLAKEHPGQIHLLMTDVVMPQMNGRDLAKHLLSFYPELKGLFMSGYTADMIEHHGVLDKDINFIQKPFTLKNLADKVRDALKAE